MKSRKAGSRIKKNKSKKLFGGSNSSQGTSEYDADNEKNSSSSGKNDNSSEEGDKPNKNSKTNKKSSATSTPTKVFLGLLFTASVGVIVYESISSGKTGRSATITTA